MHIELVRDTSDELLAALSRLVPQLTSKEPPGRDEIEALVRSGCSSLVAALDEEGNGTILGVACVSIYRVPTGVRAIIEDVVVESSVRGQGIGEALMRACLQIAREKGASVVTLTSNPKREEANRLYLKMGFARRETNAYIYKFD